MARFYEGCVRGVGLMATVSAALLTACGAPGETGEGFEAGAETETAVTSVPAPTITYVGGGTYNSRLGSIVTQVSVMELEWAPAAPCSSGVCGHRVYRRSRTGLNGEWTTALVDTVFATPTTTLLSSWTQSVKVHGGARFEYWVVVSDHGVTSPPSNTIVVTRCANLFDDEYLYANNPLHSCEANNRLYPQADGNLVLSKYSSSTRDFTTLLWNSGPKSGANRLYMQADGNLVWSAQPADVAKWTTRTNSTSTRDNSDSQMWIPGNDLLYVVKPDHMGSADILWRSDIGRAY